MMDYRELRKLKAQLIEKENKNEVKNEVER